MWFYDELGSKLDALDLDLVDIGYRSEQTEPARVELEELHIIDFGAVERQIERQPAAEHAALGTDFNRARGLFAIVVLDQQVGAQRGGPAFSDRGISGILPGH